MRILGIDIGTSSIKAVEIDSAFGRFEIYEYHDHPILPGEEIGPALQRMIMGLAKKPDKIISSLRTSQVTFRNLQLPTKDRKAILAGVTFELDDELPFSLEQAVFDYSILSQSKSGVYLHVAATLKKYIGSEIEKWRSFGVDPDILTTESWAYRAFLNRSVAAPQQEEPIVVVQIGQDKTSLYAHWRGAPIVSREIAWGGRDLTLAISQKYSIPLDRAEKTKLDHGFVITPPLYTNSTADQIEFSETLSEPLKYLVSEIRQVELTCKSIAHGKPSVIYLSGGTSLLPGLSRYLEENCNIAVKPIQALSSVSPSGITYSEHADATFLLAVSLALTQVGTEKNTLVNFRKGEFSRQGLGKAFDFASLRRPLLAAAAVTFCMILSYFVQTSSNRAELKETDAQLERGIKSFFGQISAGTVRTYVASPSRLKNEVNTELKRQTEMAKLFSPNPKSPIDFLKEISSSIPKDSVVDMVQYQVGSAPDSPYLTSETPNANLTFLMTDPKVADRLTTLLANKLSDLKKGPLEEVAAAGTEPKKYKITITGKPTEDSYGK